MNKIKQFKNKIKKKYLWRKYHDMAHYFCKGNGLEVGALCYPYLFNEDCKLKYADIFENSKLRKILDDIPLDNLYHKELVDIEYVLKPPKFLLDNVSDNTFDFVYSSHVLEHTPNPLSSLNDQLRVTKIGGIVYVVMPNKKNTYDKTRQVTKSDVLIDKFENGIFDHTVDEALDVIKNTNEHALYEPHKKNPLEYAKEIIKKKEGIHHFYTYDETNILEILIYLVKKNKAHIEYFSGLIDRDIHFALRKNN
jgi:ubiquinone/menaquinone biosynthesis C-methylase UbiE